jgi:hypothetical protein
LSISASPLFTRIVPVSATVRLPRRPEKSAGILPEGVSAPV